jgi:multisubunit Na+/H+ antiporter MnhE subunit
MSGTALVETTSWAVVACAVWLSTLSSVTLPELCIASAVSIPCGVLARAGRRSLDARWRFRPRWALWLLPVIGSLYAELVELLRMSVRRPRTGHLMSIDLPDDPPDLAAGREALGTLALSATPGSLVVDGDPEQHRLTVHVLVSAGPEVEKVIRR